MVLQIIPKSVCQIEAAQVIPSTSVRSEKHLVAQEACTPALTEAECAESSAFTTADDAAKL